MKIDKLKYIGLLLIFLLVFFKTEITTKANHYILKPQKVELVCDTTCYDEPEVVILPENFNYIYEAFKNYNPYIDSSSAIKVAEVANHFGLSDDSETLRWSIGQLLLESGAKQYYQPKHPKEGQLVVSSAGAIGFCQILPSTAYGYMKKKISYEEMDCFKGLGATNFDFAYSDTNSKKEKVIMAKEWLTDETNNIIMWGKIMSAKMESVSLMHALIAYNAGGAGLNRFLDNGNTQESHKYIKGIQTRLDYVDI